MSPATKAIRYVATGTGAAANVTRSRPAAPLGAGTRDAAGMLESATRPDGSSRDSAKRAWWGQAHEERAMEGRPRQDQQPRWDGG